MVLTKALPKYPRRYDQFRKAVESKIWNRVMDMVLS
jgi:hypothetical protein